MRTHHPPDDDMRPLKLDMQQAYAVRCQLAHEREDGLADALRQMSESGRIPSDWRAFAKAVLSEYDSR